MPRFIFIAFVVLKLYILKVSGTRKKGDLWLLLGGFWYITTPNQVQFAGNFHQRCSAWQSITYVTVFDIFLKIPRNGAKKPIFWAFFKGFLATPYHALRVTPKSFVK